MNSLLRTVFALLFCGNLSAASAAELQVGRAAINITPAVGTPMLTPQRPPYEIKLAAEAHDPIHVKAIVLEVGNKRAALVTCDLTSIPLRIIQTARKKIANATGIGPEAVMISATHSHTAPQIRPRFLGKADQQARQLASDYVAALPGKIAEAVVMAIADLQPGRVSAGIGWEDSVSFNRRYYLRDGTVKTNPFKGEDDNLGQVLRPAGPIDPEVGVVAFENQAGRPLAILVNFAIHLDTMGGDRPSADFLFMVQQIVSAVYGPDVLLYWASGASGNVNHYDLTDPVRFRREKGRHESSRIGTILAATLLSTYPELMPARTASLHTANEMVRLEYPPEKADALLARIKDAPRYFDGEVEVFNESGRVTFGAEVQAIALGNEIAFVGLPGEMFTEFGIALKKASPFRYTIIHSLANGAIGYVPNRRAYPEGSYEADATRCAPGSGERLVEVATNLLVQLKNQDLPQGN